MVQKKTVLVTGASGFVGSHFIRKYSNEYNLIAVSLKDTPIEHLDLNGVDTVLHLAGIAQQSKSISAAKYFEVNSALTEKLALKCRNVGVSHFVYFSSVKVYGYDGNLNDMQFVLTEDSPTKKSDSYGNSKIQAEELLLKLAHKTFKVAIVRPPMIYGPGVQGNMSLLIKLVDRFPLLPFDYDNNQRTLVSIGNLLHMTDLIIRKTASGTYIGDDGQYVSLKQIILSIAAGLGKRRKLIQLPQFIFKFLVKIKKNQMTRLFGSLTFKQMNNYNTLDYHPIETTNEAIRTMCRHYLAQK